MNENTKNIQPSKVRWTGYLALIFALIFFSGIFMNAKGPLAALDFTNIMGKFGKLGEVLDGELKGKVKIAGNFIGYGGTGARGGFAFGLTLFPGIMFSIGIIKVIEGLDGLRAAEKLLTPIMRMILGVPGELGLAVVANMQSADSSASLTKTLHEEGRITEKEKIIYTGFQFPAPGTITNYFSIGSIVFAYLKIPPLIPLAVIIVCKLLGGNLIRIFVTKIVKEDV